MWGGPLNISIPQVALFEISRAIKQMRGSAPKPEKQRKHSRYRANLSEENCRTKTENRTK